MDNKILHKKYANIMNKYWSRDIDDFLQGKLFSNFHLFAEFFVLAQNKPCISNYFSKKFSLFQIKELKKVRYTPFLKDSNSRKLLTKQDQSSSSYLTSSQTKTKIHDIYDPSISMDSKRYSKMLSNINIQKQIKFSIDTTTISKNSESQDDSIDFETEDILNVFFSRRPSYKLNLSQIKFTEPRITNIYDNQNFLVLNEQQTLRKSSQKHTLYGTLVQNKKMHKKIHLKKFTKSIQQKQNQPSTSQIKGLKKKNSIGQLIKKHKSTDDLFGKNLHKSMMRKAKLIKQRRTISNQKKKANSKSRKKLQKSKEFSQQIKDLRDKFVQKNSTKNSTFQKNNFFMKIN